MSEPERHIAFDTETTGLDPNAGHRVVEIGCVEMLDYMRTGRVFHAYINPERDMPAQAEKIHGLSETFLRDKPLFEEVAAEFVEFVGQSPLVAHNAGFDMKFINYELKQAGFASYPSRQSIDTLDIARRKYPGQPASLDALCRKFEIDLSARTKHGALLDAELLSDVYLELMGGRQSLLGLHAERTTQTTSTTIADKVTDFPTRQFSASNDERNAHAEFIETQVKDAIWARYLSQDA